MDCPASNSVNKSRQWYSGTQKTFYVGLPEFDNYFEMQVKNDKMFSVLVDEDEDTEAFETTTLDIDDYQHVSDVTVGFDPVNENYYVAICINAPLDWPKAEVGDFNDHDIN